LSEEGHKGPRLEGKMDGHPPKTWQDPNQGIRTMPAGAGGGRQQKGPPIKYDRGGEKRPTTRLDKPDWSALLRIGEKIEV